MSNFGDDKPRFELSPILALHSVAVEATVRVTAIVARQYPSQTQLVPSPTPAEISRVISPGSGIFFARGVVEPISVEPPVNGADALAPETLLVVGSMTLTGLHTRKEGEPYALFASTHPEWYPPLGYVGREDHRLVTCAEALPVIIPDTFDAELGEDEVYPIEAPAAWLVDDQSARGLIGFFGNLVRTFETQAVLPPVIVRELDSDVRSLRAMR